MSGAQMTRNTLIGTDLCNYPTQDITEKLLSTVSGELGIEQTHILAMSDFTDMDVDSLMSLSVVGRIREEFNLNLPTTFFSIDYPSVDKARIAIWALTGTTSSEGTTPWKGSIDSFPDDMDTLPTIHGTNDQELTDWVPEDQGQDLTFARRHPYFYLAALRPPQRACLTSLMPQGQQHHFRCFLTSHRISAYTL
jgi:acyl carrier protein